MKKPFKKPVSKKPIKSMKKVDRMKRKFAFKEGGAVERFLTKHPDYNPRDEG